MAITIMTILTILGGIGRHILEVPLIHRWIENYFDGTKTIWDGILWRALESAARIESPPDRAAAVVATTGLVQIAYDEVKTKEAEAGSPMTPHGIKVVVERHGLVMPWMEETAPIGEP